MRDVAFGQFIPGKSVIHKLDPRIKLILLVLYIVLTFCTFNYAALSVPLILAVVFMLLSRISIKQYMKSMKAVLVIIIITSILNLFYGNGDVVFQFGFLKITDSAINNAIFIVVRILCLIIASATLTFTTSPTDLTDALERLMKPLKVFHVKVHSIAMMMTIALRFVPTLLEETDKIMLAQKARGADMESGGILKRAKSLIPVLIPLFLSAIQRALDLAMAMECRCYHGGEGRTRMKTLTLKSRDTLSLVFFGLVITTIILFDIFIVHTKR
ncbi:MAG: energy-coupling factor transporter transmembrane protein EcfT [Ruminococcus sp.]|nr:energy-coupling factor transporter transmembrane protein EcfT [Ruminococcus sp.]